jgi:hypothetical protein
VRPWLLAFGVLALLGAGGGVLAHREVERRLATTPPTVPGIDILGLFTDDRPIRITWTANWQKIPLTTTRDAFRRDWPLWRHMHFEDWDTVPGPLREEALDAMLARYRHLLTEPEVWDRMDPYGWDLVPQPVRALAFRHMCEYWSGYYDVGGAHGIPRGLMADTLSAIVMTESWFDHRAVNTNPWGNRDLGVAQASDGARERFRELYEIGVVDVLLTDEDYFDPWNGTRFTARWMDLLLDDVGGDLEMAVRAYHRGVPRALAREEVAENYLETVRRRRRQYIRNQGGSPSWNYLWQRDRALIGEAWPWIRAQRDRQRATPLPSTPQVFLVPPW